MKTMHGNITTSTFTKNYVTATTFVVIIILTLPAVLAMVVNPVIEKTAVTTKSLTPPNYKLYDESSDSDAFTLLVRTATDALLERENGRRGNGDGGGTTSSVGTDLIDGVYAEALRDILDRTSIRSGSDDPQGEILSWMRWMKSSPVPIITDLSEELRAVATSTATGINNDNTELFERLQCRLLLLPSGESPSSSFLDPPLTLVFGTVLYGGVRRYRFLKSGNRGEGRTKRRAAERVVIASSIPTEQDGQSGTQKSEDCSSWLQYGGTERSYDALDIGPAAVLELIILPPSDSGNTEYNDDDNRAQLEDEVGSDGKDDMILTKFGLNPQGLLRISQPSDGDSDTKFLEQDPSSVMNLFGAERNDAFANKLEDVAGGLSPQIDAIVRRVLDGRVFRPVELGVDDEVTGAMIGTDGSTWRYADDEDNSSVNSSVKAFMEAKELEILGLTPVRGLLLYGPPGCGKTILARELSRVLRARTPKIISAPELLDRWVGGTESKVRALFADAEAELMSCGGNAQNSALHVIVIDEIDAVFRRRSVGDGGAEGGVDAGEATRSSAVNQILAKLDGVQSVPNVLVVGMTNRRELLDKALLRPGRMEVQVLVPLPDRDGRREIMNIHFDALRRRGRLTNNLCCAIDGPIIDGNNVNDDQSINVGDGMGWRSWGGRHNHLIKRIVSKFPRMLLGDNGSIVKYDFDLAADSVMNGFSGADIAGLVRCAGSRALARSRKDGSGIDGLKITLQDVKEALIEVKS